MKHPEIFSEIRSEVGEGPVYDPRVDEVLWVDILAGEIHSADCAGDARASIQVGDHIGAALPTNGEGLLLALRAGWSVLGPGGDLEEVDHPLADDPSCRFNDAACDPAGRAWGGTMAYDSTPGKGTLFRLDARQGSVPVLSDLTISNGIGWSPDGSLMYFVDSGSQELAVFKYDMDTGHIADRTPLVAFDRDLDGMPDGLTVDAAGAVWVALWGGSQVRRYTPRGDLDIVIEMPVSQVTSVVFVGASYDTLIVTSARYRLTDAQLVDEPLAGAVFAVPTTTQGLPTNLWKDFR